MSDLFISYRRADSGIMVDRLYDDLVERFGADRVFRDIHNIGGGEDFRAEIEKAIITCKVMLVVIGPSWLSITDSDGNRRLDNPGDWVRVEIEMALRHEVTVIPVLVDKTPMPDAEHLPPLLQPLAFKNAKPLRGDPDYDNDLERLVDDVKVYVPLPTPPTPEPGPKPGPLPPPVPPRQPTNAVWIAAALVIALVILVVVVVFQNGESLHTPTSSPPIDTTAIATAEQDGQGVRVGVARFGADCPDLPSELMAEITDIPAQTVVTLLNDEIHDHEAALALSGEYDLIVGGGCAHDDSLTLNLELLVPGVLGEVAEPETIPVEVPLDKLDQAAALIRAVTDYLSGDYLHSAPRLNDSRTRIISDLGQPEMALLQGNSLLFALCYPEAITAYEAVTGGTSQASDEMLAGAYNNRAVARMNWAAQSRGWGDPSAGCPADLATDPPVPTPEESELLGDALDDLGHVIDNTSTYSPQARFRALTNRAAVLYNFQNDYDTATGDCSQAIEVDVDQPAAGYLCRAAAELSSLTIPGEDYCTWSKEDKNQLETDLTNAQSLTNSLYWRGFWHIKDAPCWSSPEDQAARRELAVQDYNEFLARSEQLPVHLTLDQYLVVIVKRTLLL